MVSNSVSFNRKCHFLTITVAGVAMVVRVNWKFFKRLGIVAVVLFLMYLLHVTFLISNIYRYKMLDLNVESDKAKQDTKTILFYTKFFNWDWWEGGETRSKEYLKSVGCPNINCVFTSDRNLLDHIHDFDALVFHSGHIQNRWNVPATRTPKQVYIMATMEPPAEILYDLNLDHDFYNLTMTYRLDSDIKTTYGTMTDLKTGKRIAPAINVDWREPEDDFEADGELLKMVKTKHKTAAWFASHCDTFSKRENLVKKLQSFIDVDVYGECGPLSCEVNAIECDEMMNTTYKFYFAFENSLCIDYLTEKLYRTMKSFVIPVIYSGADLSRFLPPKSYIDSNDFDTAEGLANHLKFLSENSKQYVKYFWWKKHYEIGRKSGFEFCQICMKLNEPNFNSKRQVYESIKDWFYQNTCKHPRIKF